MWHHDVVDRTGSNIPPCDKAERKPNHAHDKIVHVKTGKNDENSHKSMTQPTKNTRNCTKVVQIVRFHAKIAQKFAALFTSPY